MFDYSWSPITERNLELLVLIGHIRHFRLLKLRNTPIRRKYREPARLSISMHLFEVSWPLDLLWTYLLLVGALGLVLMGFDKLSAKIDSERVPELWFVLISLAGGFSGVVLGMLVFHHKISKRSFQLKIAASTVVPFIVLLILVRGK
jgi:uncharacterized membrane protein YsdA (DUF1294 family)